jgi:hypothetical protein
MGQPQDPSWKESRRNTHVTLDEVKAMCSELKRIKTTMYNELEYRDLCAKIRFAVNELSNARYYSKKEEGLHQRMLCGGDEGDSWSVSYTIIK